MTERNLAALLAPIRKTTSAPKVLVFDIETSPNEVAAWGLWNQNISINQIRKPGAIICFAAGWLDFETGKVSNVEFYSDWEHGHAEMIRNLHRLFDEAHIIAGHNSKNFDVKHANREFFLQGLNPPSPYRQIDSLTTIKAQFKFVSNKLDWVSQQLGIGQKVKHEGQGLWDAVAAGDTKAQARMKKYNIQDVRLTASLFYLLRPWIKGMPNLGVFTGVFGCPTCNSENIQQNGFHRTNTSIFMRYQCNDCGTWSKRVDTRNGSTIRPL